MIVEALDKNALKFFLQIEQDKNTTKYIGGSGCSDPLSLGPGLRLNINLLYIEGYIILYW